MYKLNEFHSPFEKLDCIRAMIGNTIKLTTKENSKAGHKKCVTADDLAPILIYAIVTSSSPLLLINIKYINNFMTDDLMCGEEGYCLTTLLFAVEYIETVDLEELVKKDSDSVDDPSKHEEGEEEDAWVIVE